MSYDFRLLTLDDVDSFRALRLEGLSNAPSAFGSSYEEECDQPLGYFEDRLREHIIAGCFDGGVLVGTASALQRIGEKRKHRAELHGVYVVSDYRGRGLGRDVLSFLLDYLSSDFLQVELSVYVENAAAIHLYESLGFKSYGIRPRVHIVGDSTEDVYFMVKFLDEFDV